VRIKRIKEEIKRREKNKGKVLETDLEILFEI